MWLAKPSAGSLMDEAGGLWYNLAQPPSVGLAAPVERLLHELRHPQQLTRRADVTEEEE
jgi:A/G-specific adenine glycosylase